VGNVAVFFFFLVEIWWVFPKKEGIYNKGIITPAHFYFSHLCGTSHRKTTAQYVPKFLKRLQKWVY
jgi:hypothetical protein